MAWERCLGGGIGKLLLSCRLGNGSEVVVDYVGNHVNSHCSGWTLPLVQARRVQRELNKNIVFGARCWTGGLLSHHSANMTSSFLSDELAPLRGAEDPLFLREEAKTSSSR